MFRIISISRASWPAIAIAFLSAAAPVAAQSVTDFSGSWKLDQFRSHISGGLASAPLSFRTEQTSSSLTLIADSQDGGPAAISIYPLDGRSQKYQAGDHLNNTATKWEGAALLANIIVSGADSYSIDERWTRSRDGSTLTIVRNVVRRTGETESTLVYVDALSPPKPIQQSRALQAEPVLVQRAPSPPPSEKEYIVTAGTHILLRVTSAVSTKTSVPGDRVYFETAVPVFVNGRLIIPAGSYVTATLTESKKSGVTKGKAALTLVYDSVTLRSGVARDLRSRTDSTGGQGHVDPAEGRIEGDGHNVGKAAQTTAVGAGLGAIVGGAAGHLGAGLGIGAAAGALAGVARSRPPDVALNPGSTMDMLLDRDLRYTEDDLRARVQ